MQTRFCTNAVSIRLWRALNRMYARSLFDTEQTLLGRVGYSARGRRLALVAAPRREYVGHGDVVMSESHAAPQMRTPLCDCSAWSTRSCRSGSDGAPVPSS